MASTWRVLIEDAATACVAAAGALVAAGVVAGTVEGFVAVLLLLPQAPWVRSAARASAAAAPAR